MHRLGVEGIKWGQSVAQLSSHSGIYAAFCFQFKLFEKTDVTDESTQFVGCSFWRYFQKES